MEGYAVSDTINTLVQKINRLYERLDRRTGGALNTLRLSIVGFTEMRGAEASASLAYYALFSIFPLTFLLVAVLGFVLDNESAFRQTVLFIRTIFPFSGDLVERNLGEVTEARGAIGIIGILGAVWSASGFFSTLARNINRAWPAVKLHGLVKGRLLGMGMIGALVLLLLLSLLSTTLINLLPSLVTTIGGDPSLLEQVQGQILINFLPPLFTFLMFVALYRGVPNKVVRWKAVLIGAFFSAAVWELAKYAFTLYLRSGLARYEIVYGSLGTLIVLMVWIYLSSVISLFGAHLVASLDMQEERREEAHEYAPRVEQGAPKRTRG